MLLRNIIQSGLFPRIPDLESIITALSDLLFGSIITSYLLSPSFKVLSPSHILHTEKSLQHAHVQGFPKSAWTHDQIHIIPVLSPLPDKICFANIEIVLVISLSKLWIPAPTFLAIFTRYL